MKRVTAFRPVLENPLGAAAAGQFCVTRDQIFDDLQVRASMQRLKINRVQVAALLGEVSAFVEDIGDATAHAGGEISSAGAEHDDQTVGHVLAAVVANALDHGSRSGIADREALARHSVEESFAAGRAVESNVADDDVFFRREARIASADRR